MCVCVSCVCGCVCMYVSQHEPIHMYILNFVLRSLPPASSSTFAPLFGFITAITSGLETLELFHFQLLICSASNGRSHTNKHSRAGKKTDGLTNSSSTWAIVRGDRDKQGLGFLFCWNTFPSRQVPIRDCSAELQPHLHLFHSAVG